ncbi:hypothetical protein H8959_022713 [Pygathrix nigripes]
MALITFTAMQVSLLVPTLDCELKGGAAARPGLAAGGRAKRKRQRAAIPRGPPAGPPSSQLPERGFEFGPPGAPVGPRAALTVGGLQGTKTLPSETPSEMTSSFPSPLLRRRKRCLQWLQRQRLPRLRNRRRRWRQLHFRSGHHFRSGPGRAPPHAVFSLGKRGTGLPRPHGRGADGREEEEERRAGLPRPGQGAWPGEGPRRSCYFSPIVNTTIQLDDSLPSQYAISSISKQFDLVANAFLN